jgi:predicted flap endonuclease-1-like 5' DNA nuclease
MIQAMLDEAAADVATVLPEAPSSTAKSGLNAPTGKRDAAATLPTSPTRLMPKTASRARSGGGSSEADVTVVKGVGPVRAEKLRGVGLGTAAQLASLDAEDFEKVSKSSGVPLNTLRASVQDAKRYMDAGQDR